tara:strand:+ start:199 stop:936 length:738 start_codon:yes stop_codon:yes gene_type:complete
MSLKITSSLDNWDVQNGCVERVTDNIAYTSANPDDALVLVGPPRYSTNPQAQAELYPIGLLQQFSMSQGRGVQPMQTIGSGRAYFTAGKSTVQWNAARLFAKGPNLLKALMKNAENAGLDLTKFGERPIAPNSKNFAVNLDSELFLIPFGLQVVFRDKANNSLGSVYLEMCMISSYQIALAAGQNVIMENVSGMCDRLFSVETGNTTSGFPTGSTQIQGSKTSTEVTEAIFGSSNDGLQASNVQS